MNYLNKLEELDDRSSYKPLFQRLSTWIYIGVATAIILLLGGLYASGAAIAYSFKTEEVTDVCTESYIQAITNVDHYTTVREYNRSSAPSCSWDVDKDTWEVCDKRDSLGVCIESHTEEDYDYSVRKWKHYRTIDQNFQQYNDHYLNDFPAPRFKHTTRFIYHGKFSNQWIKSNSTHYLPNQSYTLIRYVKSGELKQEQ